MECTNCGAKVPSGLGACPQCGVFARVVKPSQQRQRSRTATWVLALLLIAIATAGATYFLAQRSAAKPQAPPPIRVVHDRPGGSRVGAGAKISEPEAILRLQRSFGLQPDCVAVMSKGYNDGAYDLTAVNRCDGTRLGRWRVDGRTGAVSKRLMSE